MLFFQKKNLQFVNMIGLFNFNQHCLLTFLLMQFFYLCFRYHDASDRAKAKVLELLRGLSAELQSKINILVFAAMLLVIAKALFAHVR